MYVTSTRPSNPEIFQESLDVQTHKITWVKYTNLLFQSKKIGLTENCLEIKINYPKDNVVLGDIPRVTLSSKVVGDLEQFMVFQDMSLEDVLNNTKDLEFTESVIKYLRV